MYWIFLEEVARFYIDTVCPVLSRGSNGSKKMSHFVCEQKTEAGEDFERRDHNSKQKTKENKTLETSPRGHVAM